MSKYLQIVDEKRSRKDCYIRILIPYLIPYPYFDTCSVLRFENLHLPR